MTDSVSGPRRYTFSALGVDLILLIFRFAQFRDKIHAQKACKLWRSLLSCKARNGDSTLCLTPGLWADRLLIVVRPPDKYRSKAQVVSTGKSYNRDPSIQLTPKEGTLSGKCKGPIQWLGQRLPGVRNLSLHFEYQVNQDHSLDEKGFLALFTDILIAMNQCRSTTSIGPELHRSTGATAAGSLFLCLLLQLKSTPNCRSKNT